MRRAMNWRISRFWTPWYVTFVHAQVHSDFAWQPGAHR